VSYNLHIFISLVLMLFIRQGGKAYTKVKRRDLSSNVTVCKSATGIVFKVRYRLKDNGVNIIHRLLRFLENYYEG
jgi:hypothetical protein